MRARSTLAAASAALFAIAGCKDSGLPDRNLPHEEAAHRPPAALVQAVFPETNPRNREMAAHAAMAQPISVAGGTFMASGGVGSAPSSLLRQVGSGAGGAFFAAAWDEPPYDRLYLAHPGGLYVSYLPLYGGGGDPAARAAAQVRTLQGEAPAAH